MQKPKIATRNVIAIPLVGALASVLLIGSPSVAYAQFQPFGNTEQLPPQVFVASGVKKVTPLAARDAFTITAPAPVSALAAVKMAPVVQVPVLSSGVGPSALSVAFGLAGIPYVSMGASRSGFDCSGLVSYALSQGGVVAPHSADGIAYMGTQISLADAQPGDLVWYPGQHIEFWVSPGVMFGASVPGTVVGTHAIWGRPVIIRL